MAYASNVKTTTKITAVIERTNRDSAAMDWAGVDIGANMLAGWVIAFIWLLATPRLRATRREAPCRGEPGVDTH
jgi:hypothetical protein